MTEDTPFPCKFFRIWEALDNHMIPENILDAGAIMAKYSQIVSISLVSILPSASGSMLVPRLTPHSTRQKNFNCSPCLYFMRVILQTAIQCKVKCEKASQITKKYRPPFKKCVVSRLSLSKDLI